MNPCLFRSILASSSSDVVGSSTDDNPKSEDGSIILRSPVEGSKITIVLSLASWSIIVPSGVICTCPLTINTCLPSPCSSFSFNVAVRNEPSVCCICFAFSRCATAICVASSLIRCSTAAHACCASALFGSALSIAISFRSCASASSPLLCAASS